MNTRRLILNVSACGALTLFLSALAPVPAPASQVDGHKPAQLMIVPREKRKEFKENIKWELYDAYQLLVTRTGMGSNGFLEDPATILTLKGSGLSVDFHGQRLGAGGLQPTSGDAKDRTLKYLKLKSSKIFEVVAGENGNPDEAIIIVPKWVKLTMASANGSALSFHLSDAHGRQFMDYSVQPDR